MEWPSSQTELDSVPPVAGHESGLRSGDQSVFNAVDAMPKEWLDHAANEVADGERSGWKLPILAQV